MTDRVRTLTITLDQDFRDDDVETIVAAIKMIRHVRFVETHVVDGQAYMARAAVYADLTTKMYDFLGVLFNPFPKEGSVAERFLQQQLKRSEGGR